MHNKDAYLAAPQSELSEDAMAEAAPVLVPQRDKKPESHAAEQKLWVPGSPDVPRSERPQWLRCLLALLYRNWMQKRRSPLASFFEFIVPIGVVCFLLWPRSKLNIDKYPDMLYMTNETLSRCPYGAYGPRFVNPSSQQSSVSVNGQDIDFVDLICERINLPGFPGRSLETNPDFDDYSTGVLTSEEAAVSPRSRDQNAVREQSVEERHRALQEKGSFEEGIKLFPFARSREMIPRRLLSITRLQFADRRGPPPLFFAMAPNAKTECNKLYNSLNSTIQSLTHNRDDFTPVALVPPDHPVFSVNATAEDDTVVAAFWCEKSGAKASNGSPLPRVHIRTNPVKTGKSIFKQDQRDILNDNRERIYATDDATTFADSLDTAPSGVPPLAIWTQLLEGYLINESTTANVTGSGLSTSTGSGSSSSYLKEMLLPAATSAEPLRNVEAGLIRTQSSIFNPYHYLVTNSILTQGAEAFCRVCGMTSENLRPALAPTCDAVAQTITVIWGDEVGTSWRELLKGEDGTVKACDPEKVRWWVQGISQMSRNGFGEPDIPVSLANENLNALPYLNDVWLAVHENIEEHDIESSRFRTGDGIANGGRSKAARMVRRLQPAPRLSYAENMIILRTLFANGLAAWTDLIYESYSPSFVQYSEAAMPALAATDDQMARMFLQSTVLGLVYTAIFLFPLHRVISHIMTDKELKLREVFQIMGCSPAVLWGSIYLFYGAWFGALSLIIAICNGPIFPGSNIFGMFLVLWCFCFACVSFGVLVSAFFQKGRTAGAAGTILYFVMRVLCQDMEEKGRMPSVPAKLASMLLFPNALAHSITTLLGGHISSPYQDKAGVKLGDFYNKFLGTSLGDCCGFLILDAVLYFVLGWYFHQLFPGEFGVAQPWYFVFKSSYWFPKATAKGKIGDDEFDSAKHNDESRKGTDMFIEVPDAADKREKIIDVRSLRMTFIKHKCLGCKPEIFEAVKGVDFDVKAGEIFALLGHNGAGKSTTINMMTGMLSPTAGDAFINGFSIRSNTTAARNNLGFCPQHDILFDFLTVEEHLYMYGLMKGVATEAMNDEIDAFLRLLNIEEKKRVLSKALSGGQKRRLSVAIALIGGSKAIFLDEPSTGMDPYTRRALWDTLKRVRENRAVVLTTHFMEEADVLGDRIGVMAGGSMRALGTPLFLKNKCGVGYTLAITKIDQADDSREEVLRQFVQTQLPGSSELSNVALEIIFKVPFSTVSSLPAVLRQFDTDPERYGVLAYSLSVTTLEEVFLTITADAEAEHLASIEDGEDTTSVGASDHVKFQDLNATSSTSNESPRTTQASGLPAPANGADVFSAARRRRSSGTSFISQQCKHLYALFIKRALIGYRDLWGLFIQVAVPVGILLVMLIISKTIMGSIKKPLRDFDSILANYPYQTLVPNPFYVGAESGVPSSLTDEFGNCQSSIFEVKVLPAISKAEFEQFLISLQKERRRGQVIPYGSAYISKGTPDAPAGKIIVVHDSNFAYSIPASLKFLSECASGAPLKIYEHPLPRDSGIMAFMSEMNSILWTVIAVSWISAGFGGFVVKERANLSKHAQHLAGVRVTTYWLSLWLWDLLLFLVPFALCLILMFAFDVEFANSSHVTATIVMGILFGISCGPFVYLIAFNAKTPMSILGILYLLSIVFPVAVTILQLIDSTAKVFRNVLQYIFMLIPHVAIAQGMISSTWFWSPNEGYASFTDANDVDPNATIWNLKVTGTAIIYLIISPLLFFPLLVFCDSLRSDPQWMLQMRNFRRRISFKRRDPNLTKEPPSFFEQEDEDVRYERERAERAVREKLSQKHEKSKPKDVELDSDPCPDQLLLGNVRKVFPPRKGNCCKRTSVSDVPAKVAVRDLSFAVPGGQCFGFLGVNGAGKTTTIQMLTGAITPSAGVAFIDGKNVALQVREAWAATGYCPQFDALFDYLTGGEHIRFYGRLAGVRESELQSFVDDVCRAVGIFQYRDRVTIHYSGGNRRKLSVGLAFLKDPKVVFLDEPSSGVDPASRRKLWDIINETTSLSQRSVILTTHSMDECEALCDRLGIMQDGRLLCIGPLSHLKHRFGRGFELQVTLVPEVSLETTGDTLLQEEAASPAGSLMRRLSSRHSRSKSFSTPRMSRGMSRDMSRDMSSLRFEEPPSADAVKRFVQFMGKHFPQSEVIEAVGRHMRWAIPKTESITIGVLFEFIEKFKEYLGVQEYSIAGASLESIFVQFQQKE